ncbi:MAG: NlpC/P60 family protein [Desulfovibrionaceae bacterium]
MATFPAWANRYVGRHFDERTFNCFDLVRTVLVREFGQNIPAPPPNVSAAKEDRAAVVAAIKTGLDVWEEINPDNVRPGDAILLRIMGNPWHCGVVLAPGWMLHVMQGTDTCIEDYTNLKWRNRVAGFYRYAG